MSARGLEGKPDAATGMRNICCATVALHSGAARKKLARHFDLRAALPPVASHIKAGASDEALICLQAADRLYTGDLFEDIPAEYADDSERDWCWSKRYWLRDMFFKVQRDAARIHRERQDYSAALAHCQKALAIDPLCEIAHEEAMQVFAPKGGAKRSIASTSSIWIRCAISTTGRKAPALRQLYRELGRTPSESAVAGLIEYRQ